LHAHHNWRAARGAATVRPMTIPPPIASLAGLVAPLSTDAFRALLEAHRPHLAQTGDPARHAGLIDWDTAMAGLSDGTFEPGDIRLYRNRRKVPSLFVKVPPPARAELVRQMQGEDAGFIVNRVERRVPAIASLCAALAGETGDNVTAGLVATCGAGSALDLHFDPYDLVVLQLDGAKRWEVFADPVDHPFEGMNVFPSAPPTEKVLTADLGPGDWLFVPAGYHHRCDTIGARSLHLSLMFYPLSLPRIADLLKRELLVDPADRASLRRAGEAEIKRALIGRIEAMSLDDLLRRHRDLPVADG